MATISGTQGSWRVDLIVNETATNINTNTSTASWELWIRRTDGGNYPMYGTPTVNIYVSGQRVYSASKYYALSSITNSGVKLESGTVSNLAHNNETGVINNNTASFTWSGSGFSPNSVSGSGTYQTAIIPRNSTITATSAYIEETSQLTVTRYKDEYTHSIAYSFGDQSGYILANGSTTSTETKLTALNIGFPIPTSWYYEIPNDTYGICTLTIKTYNGDTQVGSDYSTSFYARVSTRPTATATVIDTNQATLDLTRNSNALIKGYSTAEVTWSATPTTGATIRNVRINNQNALRSPYSFTLQDNEIEVLVTDSRLLSNSNDITRPEFTLIDYFDPIATIISIERVNPTDNFATISFNGNWFNDSFGYELNLLKINWKYRETNTEDWIDGDVLVENTDYKIDGNYFWSGYGNSANEIKIGGNLLSYEKGWDVLIEITDKLTSYQIIGSITKGIPIINWEEDFFNVNGDIRQENISIFNKFNYSTDEVVVGKWIDGKPIYRKVYTGTASGQKGIYINISDLNIDYIIKKDGWVKSTYGQWWSLNSYYALESKYWLCCFYTTSIFSVEMGDNYNYPPYRLIIEYTKTTDIAN